MKQLDHRNDFNLPGFTMIELALTIAILGILAVAALPYLFNISLTQARENAMKATASSIQTALTLYASDLAMNGLTITYPTALDSVAGSSSGVTASATNPLFTEILHAGVSAQWLKLASGNCYVYDFDGSLTVSTGDLYYQYNPTAGEFIQVVTCR